MAAQFTIKTAPNQRLAAPPPRPVHQPPRQVLGARPLNVINRQCFPLNSPLTRRQPNNNSDSIALSMAKQTVWNRMSSTTRARTTQPPAARQQQYQQPPPNQHQSLQRAGPSVLRPIGAGGPSSANSDPDLPVPSHIQPHLAIRRAIQIGHNVSSLAACPFTTSLTCSP